MKGYLIVRSEFPIQSYAQRVDWPTEKMGVPFLPLGVKKNGREADPDPIMQANGRKILYQLKDSGSFHYLTDIFSWLQYIFEEQLREKLTKTKLVSCKGWMIELISWKIA